MENKTKLTPSQLNEELRELDGWIYEDSTISRKFSLDNFSDITAFLNHLVETITEQNHHPDFSLDTSSRSINVALTTHSEHAVTRADIDFAYKLNLWIPNT